MSPDECFDFQNSCAAPSADPARKALPQLGFIPPLGGLGSGRLAAADGVRARVHVGPDSHQTGGACAIRKQSHRRAAEIVPQPRARPPSRGSAAAFSAAALTDFATSALSLRGCRKAGRGPPGMPTVLWPRWPSAGCWRPESLLSDRGRAGHPRGSPAPWWCFHRPP